MGAVLKVNGINNLVWLLDNCTRELSETDFKNFVYHDFSMLPVIATDKMKYNPSYVCYSPVARDIYFDMSYKYNCRYFLCSWLRLVPVVPFLRKYINMYKKNRNGIDKHYVDYHDMWCLIDKHKYSNGTNAIYLKHELGSIIEASLNITLDKPVLQEDEIFINVWSDDSDEMVDVLEEGCIAKRTDKIIALAPEIKVPIMKLLI